MTEPDFANPNQSEEYDPADDEKWHKQIAEMKNRKQMSTPKKIVSAVLLVIVAFIVFSLVYAWLYPLDGSSYHYPWSEAKTTIGTIKAAVDTYAFRNNGDISSLDEPNGSLEYGFVSGSNLNFKLRLEDSAFENLQYFDAEDIILEFVTDGKDGHYIIRVNGKEGGGLSGEGQEGSVNYYSQTGEWEEDY